MMVMVGSSHTMDCSVHDGTVSLSLYGNPESSMTPCMHACHPSHDHALIHAKLHEARCVHFLATLRITAAVDMWLGHGGKRELCAGGPDVHPILLNMVSSWSPQPLPLPLAQPQCRPLTAQLLLPLHHPRV